MSMVKKGIDGFNATSTYMYDSLQAAGVSKNRFHAMEGLGLAVGGGLGYAANGGEGAAWGVGLTALKTAPMSALYHNGARLASKKVSQATQAVNPIT